MAFQSKNIMVTGAASGFGKAITEDLVSEGAFVYALDRTKAGLEELKNKFPKNIEIIIQDLTDWDGVKKALADVPAVDGLVNCAGLVQMQSSVLDIQSSDLDLMWSVNLKGCVCVAQCVISKMIEAGKKGSIINFSSVAGLKPFPNFASYGASKAALDHFTRHMALEFGKKGIRTNAINPHYCPHTRMGHNVSDQLGTDYFQASAVPLGRFTEINDVVQTIKFLLSDKSAFINGVSMPLDGGAIAV